MSSARHLISKHAGSFERSMTTHYKDLRGIYAKRMECHGVGMALMQPISGEDCAPVSCGYFDRNGDWNLITRLTANNPKDLDEYFYPLEYQPKPINEVDIAWQPKTSQGVTALTVDASGDTPNNIPGGADVHIKYTSNSKFGAVLMTTKPVTLRAYNDEALFCSWLSRNQAKLYERYGPELKKYGLWIVTRTYTTRQASINAWMDKNKDSVVSLKAKAAMLGELGEDLDWRDKASDKDWSQYTAKTSHGVVVFMDGIEIKPIDWWLEGVRSQLASSNSDRGRRLLKYMPDPVHHQFTFDTHDYGKNLQQIDNEDARRKMLNYSDSQRRKSTALSPRRNSSAAAALTHRNASASPRRNSTASARSPAPPAHGSDVAAPPLMHPSNAAAAPPVQSSSAATSPPVQASSSAASPPMHASGTAAPTSHNPAAAAQPPPRHSLTTATSPRRNSSVGASHRTDSGIYIPKRGDSQRDAKPRRSSSPPPPEHRDAESGEGHHMRDSSYEFFSRSMPHPSLPLPSAQHQQLLRHKPSDDGRVQAHALTAVDDELMLKDAGLSSLSRSPSIRRSSLAPSIRSQRSATHSLRREVRSISNGPEAHESP